MDLRSRTKIRWIKFYSADLPRKSLSIKDLLIINGGLSIENPACPSSRKSDGLFFLYVQKSVGNLVLQNPSENPSCPSSRKSGGFFWFPLVQESVEKLVLQTPLFFSNIRWTWSTTWIKRFDFFPWTKGCTNWVLNPGNEMPFDPDLRGSRTLAGSMTLPLVPAELDRFEQICSNSHHWWNPRFFGVQGLGFCTGISCHRTPGRWHHCSSGTWWVFSFPLVPGDFSP